MRIIIILIILGSIGWFCWDRFFRPAAETGPRGFFQGFAGLDLRSGGIKKDPPPEMPSVSVSSAPPAADFSPPVRPARPLAPSEMPQLLGSYQFLNRPPPDFEIPAAEPSFFRVAGKNWVWRLPSDDALAVELLAKSLDKPLSSAVVEALAVAVGSSRGFDVSLDGFVSALAANVPHVSTAKIADGVFTLSATRSKLLASLDIEAGKENLSTVAAPVGVLVEGSKLQIQSLTQVPIPVLSTDDRTTRAGVEYRDIGFSFTVAYRPVSAGAVLTVDQSAGRVGRSVRIEGNDIPQIEKDTLATEIEVRPGAWYLVGGLKTDTRSGTWSISRLAKRWETANIFLIIRINSHG